MPIYEYRCDACGHQEEHLQKVTDSPLTACPSCGKAAYRKLLTAAGFQLKGSGWYVTDFRNNSSTKSSKSASDSKTEAKSDSGESKAESKSEATPKAAV